MNGFEKRAALIKEKILRTTLEMLKTWEPSKIRVADIAKAAHVSQVTIYNYFGSKEALLHEVIKDYIDTSMKEFEEYMQSNMSVKEKIERIIFHDKEAFNTFSPHMINQLLIEDDEMAEYLQRVTNEKAIPLILQMLEDGKKSGEISNKVSSQALLMFINFTLQHYGELMKMVEQSGNTDLIDSALHILFYGICGKP
ncbi:TetR/AcrR family transcriptional regulator [Heyndrickxia ginsengihumi]|uniref:TetR family transcriptional regulator n=1 Tax=Heyndrickxia ginsengihumi TaxID=363870 RepID=A0A0A6V8Y9_9BACI|nr:TetR/AcrR family transcriptional regulator [Heyndrickxia ginsengihumi]KHD84545.1 TetR family transcriptional regulator [Heyndrickxia ginsengihumi]MBE6185062.1 TetR/AcrR family transcriptional regulator [Bacillus sp. (in: firmicutes)]NEY18538.1 TetR/AcrR family transcriptional regulator [Heyndrickxia ginsengihumi]